MNRASIAQWWLRFLIFILAIAWVGIAVAIFVQSAADGSWNAMLMESWPRPGYRIAGAVSILCAGPTMLVATYYFLSTLAEMRPEARALMGPFAFLLPRLWTEKGNRHRKLAGLWFAIFLLLFAVTAICFELGGGSNARP